MPLAFEILTAIGALGLVGLSIFIISGALRRVMSSSVRSYMSGKGGATWFGNGFTNSVIGCDANGTASTVFGYAHSKMLSYGGVIYSLLGIGVAPIVFLVVIYGVLWANNLYYLSLPLIGVGYALELCFHKSKSGARLIIGVGLLITGLFLCSDSVNGLFDFYIYSDVMRSLTNTGVLSIILGVGIGSVMTVILRSQFVTLALLLILLSHNGFGVDLLLGATIGSVLGQVFIISSMASRGGTLVKRPFLQYSIGVVLAIIIFCVGYYFLPDTLSGQRWTFLSFSGIFFIFILPLGVYLGSFLAPLVSFFIPNAPKEGNHLIMLSNTHRPDSTLALLQVQKEIVNHTRRTYKMVSFLRDILNEPDKESEKVVELYDRIEKYKVITDRVESEIVGYICSVALGDISRRNTVQMQTSIVAMGKVNQIADTILSVSRMVRLGYNREHSWEDGQLEVFVNCVRQLQLLQYRVISSMESGGKKGEEIDVLYGEFVTMVNKSNSNFYLYNQVLMIETLSELKIVAKLLCNLLK